MSSLVCPRCSAVVPSGGLEAHLRLELDYPGWRCLHCGALFLSFADAARHFQGPFNRHPGLPTRILETFDDAKNEELTRLFTHAQPPIGMKHDVCQHKSIAADAKVASPLLPPPPPQKSVAFEAELAKQFLHIGSVQYRQSLFSVNAEMMASEDDPNDSPATSATSITILQTKDASNLENSFQSLMGDGDQSFVDYESKLEPVETKSAPFTASPTLVCRKKVPVESLELSEVETKQPRQSRRGRPGCQLSILPPDDAVWAADAFDDLHVDLAQLNDIFSEHERGLRWLARHGLIANQRRCPVSVSPVGQPHSDGDALAQMTLIRCDKNRNTKNGNTFVPIDRYRWRCRQCRRPTDIQCRRINIMVTIRQDTIWERSHLSLGDGIRLIYSWAHYPTRKLDAVCQLFVPNFTKNTVIEWFGIFRDVCAVWALEGQANTPLGGEGKVVDIDECKLWASKRAQLGGKEGTWVVALLERGSKAFAVPEMATRSVGGLFDVLTRDLRPGTRVYARNWDAYGNLEGLQNQLRSRWANNKLILIDSLERDIHTEWSLLYSQLDHLQNRSEKLFKSTTFQRLFRRVQTDNPDSGIQMFGAFLKEIRRQYPFPY